MNQNHTQHKDNFMRNLFIGLILIITVLLGFNYWQSSKSEAPTGEVPAVANNIIRVTDHIIGKRNASVVLVEYADLQCPACKAFEPILTKIAAEYANDNFAYVFRYFPLVDIHSHAMLAAQYNEAAGNQGKFWEMNHMLYDKQVEWADALDAESKIKGYASQIGLDVNKLSADANSKEIINKINASLAESNKIGLKSTPSLLLNGTKITVKSEEDLRAQIKAVMSNTKNNNLNSTTTNKK